MTNQSHRADLMTSRPVSVENGSTPTCWSSRWTAVWPLGESVPVPSVTRSRLCTFLRQCLLRHVRFDACLPCNRPSGSRIRIGVARAAMASRANLGGGTFRSSAGLRACLTPSSRASSVRVGLALSDGPPRQVRAHVAAGAGYMLLMRKRTKQAASSVWIHSPALELLRPI